MVRQTMSNKCHAHDLNSDRMRYIYRERDIESLRSTITYHHHISYARYTHYCPHPTLKVRMCELVICLTLVQNSLPTQNTRSPTHVPGGSLPLSFCSAPVARQGLDSGWCSIAHLEGSDRPQPVATAVASPRPQRFALVRDCQGAFAGRVGIHELPGPGIHEPLRTQQFTP